jgi:hypothetical protein
MIDASQRMLRISSQGGGKAKDGGGLNPVMKKDI